MHSKKIAKYIAGVISFRYNHDMLLISYFI